MNIYLFICCVLILILRRWWRSRSGSGTRSCSCYDCTLRSGTGSDLGSGSK